jgi:hypothetical protein
VPQNHPPYIKPVKLSNIEISTLSILLLLPTSGRAADLPLTTRRQTVRPLAVPADTRKISLKDVPLYKPYGYSAWQLGPGVDEGRKFNLMPSDYTGVTKAALLLSYFSLSDVHITDKESPAQLPWFGWTAPFGGGGLFECAYSPIMRSTTHVLDAAVKTLNTLHRQTPFDFGLALGDVANCDQFNALRWFIDVMDGKWITPSSGAHLGADTVDYQKPYQAAGLDRSIPWYEAIGKPLSPTMQTKIAGYGAALGSSLISVNPLR